MEMEEILRRAVQLNASDILITSGRPPIFRIDGKLEPQDRYPSLDTSEAEKLISELLLGNRRKELDERFELDFSHSIPEVSRFRVNVYFRDGGMAAAIRIIPSRIPTLGELKLPPIVDDLIQEKNGLVLVTGPTGSGKSTTLAAMIDAINKSRKDHIITIEDPIEFVYKHDKAVIDQRELYAHTHSFANALKHIFRQTPDVVLVGEMRDLETISLAITVAETGHLVFGTLHTMGAAQTVNRIVDVFPSHQQQQIRIQLASALKAVISQLLLPRKTGGRIAAREIMVVDTAISSLIREGKTHQIYGNIETGSSEGMITMEMDVAMLLANDMITYETAISAVNDEDTFLGIIDRVDSRRARKEDARAHDAVKSGRGQAKATPRTKEKDEWWKQK
jgi:twitching motility protein PilT